MLRRIPRATWILVAVAAVLGLVGMTMEHMLVRDVLLMGSIGTLAFALILVIKPSRERRYPDAPPSDDAP
ncbi:hypothetical protein [Agrococcus sp. SGAir0287]|uniref:hypothetical protein n=1 Tax=Agrococcus sp. SGAir0287 TaxID=2070347 RepID=UPI0010CCDC02|nr:hypothetical protein [Agrococcus sp. SGAir0287]QCR19075.1 hypothetical protein C1N71_06170 [Agrococcus sp. SGAir0287]